MPKLGWVCHKAGIHTSQRHIEPIFMSAAAYLNNNLWKDRGLELKPHDFFDFNPLGGPSICD
jgi:hypothetical protein